MENNIVLCLCMIVELCQGSSISLSLQLMMMLTKEEISSCYLCKNNEADVTRTKFHASNFPKEGEMYHMTWNSVVVDEGGNFEHFICVKATRLM